MASSETSICNQALGWLGQEPITSLNDPSRTAELCKINYDPLRETVLEEGNWSFALKRWVLDNPVVDTPDDWGDYFRFPVPADQLLVVGVFPTDQERDQIKDWRVEDNHILASQDTIFVRTIANVTDVPRFTKTFIQALAARLAADLAIPITQSRTLQQDMWALYTAKLDEALAADGKQGAREGIRTNRLTGARWRYA